MLRPQPLSGHAGWAHSERLLRGFLSLSQHRKNWLRDVEDWNPSGDGLNRQFGSLARHLLATHAVPGLMTNVWFEEPSPTAVQHQKLFKHLGLGNSIRGAELPIRLTKPMAEFFAQAPDHLSVEQALRWSQVRGLGGDKPFAAEVLSTRLGTEFEYEDFWVRVLQFLIERPRLDRGLVAPVIDYMHVNRDGILPQPFRRMTERSFETFLRRVRKWMSRSAEYRKSPELRWPKTGIGGLRFIEPQENQWSMRCWTIRELGDSRELIDEGNELHHCVATYAEPCAKRTTSIWSLRCHGSLESHRVLTIEVLPTTRMIITAQGKCNSEPKPDARSVMEMWAAQQGLEIGMWV